MLTPGRIIKILLVDDHTVVRKGIRMILRVAGTIICTNQRQRQSKIEV